jgi:hypothetical protein
LKVPVSRAPGERDIELVQRLLVTSEDPQGPGQVRSRHDLVVARAPRLQLVQALANVARGALGVAHQDLQPFDVARDIPRREIVVRALGDFARLFEVAERRTRFGLDCRRLRGIQR